MTHYGEATNADPRNAPHSLEYQPPRAWLPRALVLVALLAAFNFYLLGFAGRSSRDNAEQDALASVLLWISTVPLVGYVVRRPRTVPFFPAVCVVYGIYLALPRFTSRPLFSGSSMRASPDRITLALVVALIGVTMLIVGHFVGSHLFKRLPRLSRDIDLSVAVPWLAGCAILVLADPSVIGLRALGQIPSAFTELGELSLAGLFLAYLRRQVGVWVTVYMFGLVMVRVVIGLGSGLLSAAGLPLIPLAFVFAWERRTVPWGFLAVSLLCLVVLGTGKSAFRAKYWTRSGQSGGRLSNGIGYLNITRETVMKSDPGDLLTATTERTNMLATLTFVTSETPAHVPYWDGYTLQDIPWHWIPRILVPEKPAHSFGQEFPRRYGLIDYADTGTAFNMPELVELYINFGIAGVLVGMALIGAFYSLVSHVLGGGASGALIASCLFTGMLLVEGDIGTTL
ncbi:MAG: hypothetical protein ABTD50_10830, partial [Polyangiaceae bacterium]